MIHLINQIQYKGNTVFTKLKVSTPLKESLQLPADACCVYIEDGDGQELYPVGDITAKKNTIILSTCGMTMGNIIESANGNMESTIAHLDRELLRELFKDEKPLLWEELNSPISTYLDQAEANNFIKQYFQSLATLFNMGNTLSDAIIKVKMQELVLMLMRSENSESIRKIINSLFSDKEFSFEEVVEAHINTPANIENLAALLNMSLSSFKRNFKEIYNSPPAQYMKEKRLERIANELRASDLPIQSIGFNFGFENPEQLSRDFKKKYGVSPKEFRLNQ